MDFRIEDMKFLNLQGNHQAI